MPYPSAGVLARYTRDLTADARAGRLDPIRCRDDEVARVLDILLRRDKNNPVLLGEAGVGKTAIAEALAWRLAGGDVPLGLRGMRLLALDHVALLAGTMYRGQYEERLRGLVEEVGAAHDVILFVDELHNLVGQGTAIGVAMDAANMLKPALARGQFRVLGATTSGEYDRWIRSDPALERRFQPVAVRELGPEETLDVLHSRRETLERHHAVAISDDALLAAVRLTDLFLPERRRPDRAIDALDEACAHMHAVTSYDADTERMVRRLRALEGGHVPPAAEREPEHEREANGAGAASAAADDDDPEAAPPEWERLARDGFSAIERLGAEIEAFFAPEGADPPFEPPRDSPAPGRARGTGDTRGTSDAGPSGSGARRATGAGASTGATGASGAPAAGVAELRAGLRRRLMEQGVVVRGHDVARVVSLMTGKRVTWVD
ncbi:MAG TPA: AAA family ATPase [Gemmatimonadales bacterium]